MNNEYIVAIPARYKSSRLPGKPLKLINGKAMINHVWDLCIKAVGRKNVIVLTDDIRIKKHCIKHKISFFMTSKSCKTGTDRIYQFAKKNFYKYYINVQGDEPLLDPNSVKKVLNFTKKVNSSTNCYSKCTLSEYKNKNIPKVVINNNNDLLYMSRAPIPSSKIGNRQNSFNKQICIYGFIYKDLIQFGKTKLKSRNEELEDIEILRFLDMGIKIKMLKLNSPSMAVDTLKDLKKVRKIFENKFKKN